MSFTERFFKRKSGEHRAPVADAIEEELAAYERQRASASGALQASDQIITDPFPLNAADRVATGREMVLARDGTGLVPTGGDPEELRAGVDPKLLKLLTPQFAHELLALPYRLEGDTVVLAVAELPDSVRHHRLLWIVNSASDRRLSMRFTPISRALLRQCLDIYYPWSSHIQLLPSANDIVRIFIDQAGSSSLETIRAADLGGSSLSVKTLVQYLLLKAVGRNASDITFEPDRMEFRVRFKVEGECEPGCTAMPPSAGPRIVSVIKQWAGLDIAEHERTQDGKFMFRLDLGADTPTEYRFRVAITPTIHGEECTIRVHQNSSTRKRIDSLAADPRTHDLLWEVVNTRRGFVLLTGPTAHGKTTTLASILSECDSDRERIITIEDPVEIPIEGIAQTQINEHKGETYERLVRNALRRAPDRILIGEIRDKDTAHHAIKAALTGHQVLSTVHADHVVQVPARFTQDGSTLFSLASALTLVVAQRLVNLLCEHCAVPVTYEDEVLLGAQFYEAELGDIRAREAGGCAMCGFKGTNGRVAIYESMVVTPDIKRIITANRPDIEEELEVEAVRGGMRPLRRRGLDMVKTGQIALAQVVALCRPMAHGAFELLRDSVASSHEGYGFAPHATGDWVTAPQGEIDGTSSGRLGEDDSGEWQMVPVAGGTDDPGPAVGDPAEITEPVDWIRPVDDDWDAKRAAAASAEPLALDWAEEEAGTGDGPWTISPVPGTPQAGAPALGASAAAAQSSPPGYGTDKSGRNGHGSAAAPGQPPPRRLTI
ncbi:MAG: type II/IV secretion system protein [Acidobacteria bacterium]|nr:type II/IV secretion system protein [Acidobacteriota bacterium]